MSHTLDQSRNANQDAPQTKTKTNSSTPLQMCQPHKCAIFSVSELAFSQTFLKGFLLSSPCHSILATSQCSIAQVALDERYANKFAPLDSMTIYPKPGHELLYSPMTG
jgi:hypothetical protein